MRRTLSFFALLALAVPFAAAQELKPVPLPKPRTEGGMPLMQALKARQSTREFDSAKLSPETLSNLLWAAFGVNRSDGRRTAPSAVNWQEIDIYVATPDGVYLYDAKANVLQPVIAGDFRGATGPQPFVKNAAVNLVYVADTARMRGVGEPQQTLFSAADTGFIAQNVYLFCASEGLGVVARGMVDREAVAKTFKLRPEQRVMLAQSVGYPKK
jgi:SagB-type dehydrogenase family enzyme